MGANPLQTLKAFREAESYRGPSLIIAFSHCIAHGIDMTHGDDASEGGGGLRLLAAVPLRPAAGGEGEHPFHLDSRKPTGRFKEFAMKEARFAMLARSKPEQAERLLELAQQDIDERWHFYEQLAGVERLRSPDRQRSEGGEVMSVDLTTRYLGLKLKNPLVVSACPLTGKLDTLRRLEEAGAAAAVLPSLFEEQIEHDEMEIDRALRGSGRTASPRR